jgi:hypothetical protein
LDRKTLSYADIEAVLDNFYGEHIRETNRNFCLVSGDQQVWIKLFYLRKMQPIKYSWLIPIPGEFHWNWHILKGIFILWGKHLLLPFSKLFGYSTLDLECNNFHYAEDFLQTVTLRILKWVKENMKRGKHKSITAWLHSLKHNSIAYELVYALTYYFIPYWVTRSALKWNKYAEMENLWRYWTHLFIATGKTNYSKLSIRFLWILKSMHPDIRAAYDLSRVMSFSGEEGTGIPIDGMNEMVKHSKPLSHSIIH